MVDRSSNNIPSCLMLAANLITPVSLASVFEAEDLKETGIEFDSHVTLLYSKTYIDKDDILKDIEDVLRKSEIGKSVAGGFSIIKFLEHQKELDPRPVLDLFELSNFENDSGYVVLRLKPDTGFFHLFKTINEGLSEKYGVVSEFGDYKAHLTLAELEPGRTKKYMDHENLKLILRDSLISFEDLIFSYDLGEKDFKVFDLTHNMSVDRYFRIKNAKLESKEFIIESVE